jgi:hypothetical protein
VGLLDEDYAKIFGTTEHKLSEELAKLIGATKSAYKFISCIPMMVF